MNLSTITGLFSGLNWQALALKAAAVLIAAGLIFGAGYYKGEQSVVKPIATATVNAATQGVQAQSKKTAADAVVNHADSTARQGANQKRDDAVAAIKKSEPALLASPPPAPNQLAQVCPPVSAEAMSKLNDPDIIGKDAQ